VRRTTQETGSSDVFPPEEKSMGTKAPRVVVVLLAVLIGELSATALRGSQEPTYKVGILAVAVYATVTKYAEEEDVMVYAIGLAPGEVNGGGGFGRGGPGFPGRGRGGFGGRGRSGGYARRVDKPDEGLPKIAAATGGGYFELTSANDLAATFARVADELHHQYALGFTPLVLDGKMHSLDLRVKGEGMKARARKSYLARGVR